MVPYFLISPFFFLFRNPDPGLQDADASGDPEGAGAPPLRGPDRAQAVQDADPGRQQPLQQQQGQAQERHQADRGHGRRHLHQQPRQRRLRRESTPKLQHRRRREQLDHAHVAQPAPVLHHVQGQGPAGRDELLGPALKHHVKNVVSQYLINERRKRIIIMWI